MLLLVDVVAQVAVVTDVPLLAVGVATMEGISKKEMLIVLPGMAIVPQASYVGRRGTLLWRAAGQRGSPLQRAAVDDLRAAPRRQPGVGEQVLSSRRRCSSLSLFSTGAPLCCSTMKFVAVVPSSSNFPRSQLCLVLAVLLEPL